MKKHYLLILLLCTYVVMAVGYSFVVPLGEASDEVSHWAYVRYLLDERQLPPSQGAVLGEAHQPPLYYLLEAAAVGWVAAPEFSPIANPDFSMENQVPNLFLHPRSESFPFSGSALAWHLGRLVSVLLGAVTVWATWEIALELVPHKPWIALGASAFVAFLPQFLVISAVISNDILVVMLSSTGILITLRMARGSWGWRESVALGILLGLALLAKLSGLVLWIFSGALLGIGTIKSREWAQAVRKLALVYAIAVCLTAPWMWNNWVIYGDPLGWLRTVEVVPRQTPLSLEGWAWIARQLFTSFWGRFGGTVQIRMDRWVYVGLAILTTVPVIGWALYVRDAARNQLDRRIAALAAIVALFWAILILSQIRWAMSALGSDQARQLFPGLSLLAVFLAGGLERAVGSRANQVFGVASLGGGTFALAVIVFLSSVYAPAAVPANSVPVLPSNAADFGGTIRVLNVQYEPVDVLPGQEVSVSVYWEALKPTPENYWLLLQLDGKQGAVANKEGVPAAGRLTTDLWQIGQVFVSDHAILIPADEPAGELKLRMGIHPFGKWDWLPVHGQEMLELGKINVE